MSTEEVINPFRYGFDRDPFHDQTKNVTETHLMIKKSDRTSKIENETGERHVQQKFGKWANLFCKMWKVFTFQTVEAVSEIVLRISLSD